MKALDATKREEIKELAATHGAYNIRLFGSVARREARSDSDIDVFVDPAPNRAFGFLPFMDALETIQHAVGENVDYGTRKGLHPLLRPDIEREAARIFLMPARSFRIRTVIETKCAARSRGRV